MDCHRLKAALIDPMLQRCNMQLLRKFHRSLLNLYPDNYREEFGEELQMVSDKVG